MKLHAGMAGREERMGTGRDAELPDSLHLERNSRLVAIETLPLPPVGQVLSLVP